MSFQFSSWAMAPEGKEGGGGGGGGHPESLLVLGHSKHEVTHVQAVNHLPIVRVLVLLRYIMDECPGGART